MAKMIPDLTEEQLRNLKSKAEAKFYRACRDQLLDDVLVIHSVGWIYRDGNGHLREGEADFTIISPSYGILTIEVKGGGVAFDAQTGNWYSIDRHQNRNKIKDPFRQASNERHSIKDQLAGSSLWRDRRGKRFTLGHAVMLPDVHDARPLLSPDRRIEFIGVDRDMQSLSPWISGVYGFWRNTDDQPIGAQGVELVQRVLCSSSEALPALKSYLDDAEQTRIRLTNGQSKILRTIGGRKKAIISGGAGTGKTLIAVEKARQLAAQGLDVLLICYNRPLADAISRGLSDIHNISAMSFHQLCELRIQKVQRLHNRNLRQEASNAYPGTSDKHKYEVQMPFALALSNEILDEKFDALLIDEAQDFSSDYWLAMDGLLRDSEQGYLYIFLDENQSLYRRPAELPVNDEPFYLAVNCRNTLQIHRSGYAYYSGEDVDEPDLNGQEIERISVESDSSQATEIAKIITGLLSSGVPASDIVVLLAKQPKNRLYELLNDHKLTSGVEWSEGAVGRKNAVLVDTVARFKGLEAPAVVLWLGDEILDADYQELLYVGITRAKSLLYVVGSKRTLPLIS